jgi:hypothetical protein
MVESEIGVMVSQCLNRRIPGQATLIQGCRSLPARFERRLDFFGEVGLTRITLVNT